MIWLVSPSIKNLSSPFFDSTRNPVRLLSPTKEAEIFGATRKAKVLLSPGSWSVVRLRMEEGRKTGPLCGCTCCPFGETLCIVASPIEITPPRYRALYFMAPYCNHTCFIFNEMYSTRCESSNRLVNWRIRGYY